MTATIPDAALIRPGESGYDAARQVWNAMVDHRPAMIARCRATGDVVAASSWLDERMGLRHPVRRPQRRRAWRCPTAG